MACVLAGPPLTLVTVTDPERREADGEHLVSLLSERWVLALATLDADGATYSTALYFALLHRADAGRGPGPQLVFLSSPSTAHGEHLGAGPTEVSASTYLETRAVGEIRGVQLRGVVVRGDTLDEGSRAAMRAAYLEAHPVARRALDAPVPPSLYLLSVRWAKLTDNRLGMGKHPVLRFPGGDGPA